MKKILTLFALILFTHCGIHSNQSNITSEDEVVRETLENIFNLAVDKDLKGLSKHIAYIGNDSNRKYKDVLHITDSTDLLAIKRIQNRINNYLQNDFKIIRYFQEEQKGNKWYIIKFKFNKKQVYFAFLKINGKYVLGDID